MYGTAEVGGRGGPALFGAGCPIADVQSLPVGERAELLALTRRLLEILPNPSHAREVVLSMLEVLEPVPAVDAQDAG